MNVEELVKALEAQRAENQTLRHELAKALESLEQANARIKQLEGQAAKDSHNSSKPPSTNGFKCLICQAFIFRLPNIRSKSSGVRAVKQRREPICLLGSPLPRHSMVPT